MAVRMVATVKRYIGLSTDIKPVDDTSGERVWDGSSFFEEDTAKFFLYDQAEGWTEKDPDKYLRGGELVSATYDATVSRKLDDVLVELKRMGLYLSVLSGEEYTKEVP